MNLLPELFLDELLIKFEISMKALDTFCHDA